MLSYLYMILTIDTGGTKTLFGLYDKGTLISTIKIKTPKDYNDYLKVVKDIMLNNYDLFSLEAISIAIPGIIKNDRISYCGRLKWHDKDIKAFFAEFLPNTPVFLENDASLGALGAVREDDFKKGKALYITLSTGIGTGFILNNKIDPISKSLEGGMMVVQYKDKVDQWQSIASGSTISNTYGEIASKISDETSLKEIALRIAVGLRVLIPLLSPDKVYFGGGAGIVFNHAKEQVLKELKDYIPDRITFPEIKTTKDPELVVLRGCYEYAKDRLNRET